MRILGRMIIHAIGVILSFAAAGVLVYAVIILLALPFYAIGEMRRSPRRPAPLIDEMHAPLSRLEKILIGFILMVLGSVGAALGIITFLRWLFG